MTAAISSSLCAAAEQGAEVVAAAREQAGVELAVGREPGARAVAAERLRHRRDDADLAAAVLVAPALGDLAAVVAARPARAASSASIALDDLARPGTTSSMPPAVRRADVHVLDEAHDVAGAAEVAREVDDVWSLTPRWTTALTLSGLEPGLGGRLDALEHRATGKPTSFIARKTSSSSESRLTVTRRRPASASACACAREQRRRSSSGRGRAVRGCAASMRDQLVEVAADQRLAAGEADLFARPARRRSAPAARSPRRSAAPSRWRNW